MEEKGNKPCEMWSCVDRDSKEGTDATDKNLNHGFRAYLRRVDNPDRDRAVLKREGMDRKGDNSDSKGLEVVLDHHIHCSRLAWGELDHRDWDQDHCMKDSSTLDDSGRLLLFHGNRLSHEGHPSHHQICGICLDLQEGRPCGQDSRNLRRMDDVDS